MLTTPWTKVLIDLWENRSRTLVVALAIAVGVYAVGVVLNTREILVREYKRDQANALMASAVLHTAPFEDDLTESLNRLPLVVAVEGRTMVSGRVRLADGAPQDIVLIAVPDFARMQVDAIERVTGAYPPKRREIVMEGASLASVETALGQDITIEFSNDAVRSLRVVGAVHDAQTFSPTLSGTATGYISTETLAALGYLPAYTELRIRATEPAQDEAHITIAAEQVTAQLEETGRTVYSRQIITESVADPYISSVVLILTAFGVVILLLSGFLVVNSMSALITQQVPQIGVMKLIGATRKQIIALYLVTVLIYGLIAVALALPLAALTARLLMSAVVEPLLNVQTLSYSLPLPILLAQAAVGLLLPLVAGIAPVWRGTQVTTHAALNDAGMGGGNYGKGVVERLLGRLQRMRGIQRPVLLAIRNTLRHKGRLIQTLVVLVFSTALFISVLSVRSSVNATLDSFMRFHRYDVAVELERPELIARLEQAAAEIPGVAAAEVWSQGGAKRVRPDNSESNAFRLVAAPPQTQFMEPELLKGRWLPAQGGPANPMVVNSDFADRERDVQPGSSVVLDINGREATWTVVGVVSTESRGPTVYVARDDYAYALRTPGQGDRLIVKIAADDPTAQHEMAVQVQEHLDAVGLKVRGVQTAGVTQTENQLLFTVVVAFLILMALLLAAVGGLGLTTTMSINMMERVREVGVLRAIGASNTSIRQIVLAEGMAIAVLSWFAGTALSFFLSPVFSEQLGVALIKIPLRYHYSFVGAAVWFVILLAIAAVASLAPARNAVRLTVREVLAYE